MRKWLGIWFFLSFASLPCFARVVFQYSFENYFSVSGQQPSEATWNSTNRLLQIPAASANIDLRPDFNWQWNNGFKIILRPRFSGFQNVVNETQPTQTLYNSVGKFDVTDAYADGPITSELSYVLGLQVYQWGPAELMSPSNPIYHFRNDQRSVFYKEKGHALVRLNWIHENFSFVIISEPVSNQDGQFQSGVAFQPKNLVKFEYQSMAKRSDYLGLTFGSENPNSVFVGEYGNFSPVDGWSLYVDAKHPQTPISYTVYTDNAGYNYLDTISYKTSWYTMMDVGTRWEGDWDWRLEYIYNSPGLTSQQFVQAYQSTYTLSPYIFTNLPRFANSGLELYEQNYVYFSVRLPDLGRRKKVNAAVRYLYSLGDSSGGLQLDVDRVMSDSLVGYIEATAAFGAKDTELTILNRLAGFVGFKWVL